MCEQTVIRFFISLKETCSNLITFKMINKYGSGAIVQIAKVLGQVHDVTSQGVF